MAGANGTRRFDVWQAQHRQCRAARDAGKRRRVDDADGDHGAGPAWAEETGAEMVIYETPGGGATFSVGSITWPSSILVDDVVSHITRNVLDRFLRVG